MTAIIYIEMRRSKADTSQTRERIVKTAASEFRRNGIAATGLSDIMAAAGLTHGGFYRHFESKDQLAVEACRDALESMTGGMAARVDLTAVVSNYLSSKHRDRPENGCPLAALGSELGRAEEPLQAAATDGYLHMVQVIAKSLVDLPAREAQTRAMVIASAMIGALTISRIVKDTAASDAVLSATRKTILENLC
jgi:TetR/AcrR family transcriptional regulator, transcriptional repressor for nem operon